VEYSGDERCSVTAEVQKCLSSSCRPRPGNTESVVDQKTHVITEMYEFQISLEDKNSNAIKRVTTIRINIRKCKDKDKLHAASQLLQFKVQIKLSGFEAHECNY